MEDIVERGGVRTAIADVSFTAHMPDCLEMPYQPRLRGAEIALSAETPRRKERYRIGGNSCLAGDVMGDWLFDEPLAIGDPLIFEDMMHYTMVKSTMFNGVHHPAIGLIDSDWCVQHAAGVRLTATTGTGSRESYKNHRYRLRRRSGAYGALPGGIQSGSVRRERLSEFTKGSPGPRRDPSEIAASWIGNDPVLIGMDAPLGWPSSLGTSSYSASGRGDPGRCGARPLSPLYRRRDGKPNW